MEAVVAKEVQVFLDTRELKQSLKILGKVVSSMPIVPSLEMIMFDLRNGKLLLTGSDLKTFVFIAIDCDGFDGEFQFLVHYKTLTNVLKHAKDDRIGIEYSGVAIKLTWSDCSVVLVPDIQVGDFPAFKDGGCEYKSFDLSTDVLTEGLRMCSKTISKDDLRPAMTGVSFDTTDGKLSLVSTTGYALTNYRTKIEVDSQSFIVGRVIHDLISAGAFRESRLTKMEVSSSWVNFGNGRVTVCHRLNEDQYPDWRRAIEAVQPVLHVELDPSVLLKKLQLAVVLSNQYTNLVSLQFHKKGLRISSADADSGFESSQEMPTNSVVGTANVSLGFNGKMLSSILSLCGSSALFQIQSSNKGVFIKSKARFSDEVLFLAMPVLTK